MRQPFDWVFFDAGETLFQVADPLPEYGDVLAHLGYVLSPEQIAVAFGRARSASMA